MVSPSSRRRFLESSVALGAATGCTAKAATSPGACFHDCPDGCAWTVTSQAGKLVRIEAVRNHPYTRGELCPRMDYYLDDIVNSPNRLLHPLRRTGAKGEAKFERVSWDAALDAVASKLQQIIQESGPTAILPYSFAGTEGVVHQHALSTRFFNRLGATRLDRNICGDAGNEGVKATLGASTGVLPADVVHSRYILIWGANPALTAPHSWHFIQEARRQGARVVTIDPQFTASAKESDWHLQPLPGTDAALALGLMHIIVAENLHDADYVQKHTLGFDKLKKRLAEFPPARTAAITGLKQQDIETLARQYAKPGATTIRVLVGMEHHANGAMAYRAISCLPALTGAWRHRGGGLLYMAWELCQLNYDAVLLPKLENPKTRSVNMVQLGQALTSNTLNPAIRCLVVYNSNPATIAPNQNLVLDGLRRPDLFTVVLDQFMTDTARYADFVFPAATQVELLDLIPSWGQNYIAINLAAAPPAGESVPNSEFFRRLARKMNLTEPYLFDSDEQILRAALNTQHPYLKGITYERLAAEGWAPLNIPDPWLPFANGGFQTPSGKCEFYSETWAKKGLDPLPAHVPIKPTEGSNYPLRFLSSKSASQFLNSSHAGVPRAAEAQGRPFIQMHPSDAKARKIADGDPIRLFNPRGSLLAPVQLNEKILPGVVSISHGWWASLMPGKSSANALTRDGLTDLGGGGDFLDTFVEAEREPARPIEA